MVKTTLYLPEDLKQRLEQAARQDRRSEAELIREAISESLSRREPPRPRLPLFASGDPDWAANADAHLAGFGEHD